MTVQWDESYRIIFSRFPFVGIFDRITDPANLEAVEALECRTNDRILEDLGQLALVRPEDRIAGPGSTPIMAAFTHSRPSRFSDGSFGIYYAGKDLDVALAESRFHLERFYRATSEASADVDMRVYCARINGTFESMLCAEISDPRLDPNSYAASQPFGRSLYQADLCDGLVYPSVRDLRHHPAVACFRPRTISDCYPHSCLIYRWDAPADRVTDIIVRETLAEGRPAS